MYDIKKLKNLYSKGVNINEYLRKKTNLNERDIIKLSYDLQSGSYIKNYNYKKSLLNINQMIKEVKSTNFKTLLDFGCGELTNFYTLIKNIKSKNKYFYATDLSFSRIFLGNNFLSKKKISINLTCFTNNTYKIPLPDNSVDIVTTCHAIEPNKRNANKILNELYRITKKKLILLEPNNQFTKKTQDKKTKKMIERRFKKHNYVLNLEKKIKQITSSYKIIDNANFFNIHNPSSLFIIEKKIKNKNMPKFLNPNDNSEILKKNSKFYFSGKTGELFPIIENIIIFDKKEIFVPTHFE